MRKDPAKLAVSKVAVFTFQGGELRHPMAVDEYDEIPYDLERKAETLAELSGAGVEVQLVFNYQVKREV